MPNSFSIESAISILENIPAIEETTGILTILRSLRNLKSQEEGPVTELRTMCRSFLDDKYARIYDQAHNFSVQDAVYYTLIALSKFSTLDSNEPFTQEEVLPEEELVYVSAGHRFHLTSLITNNSARGYIAAENGLPDHQRYLVNVLTREPFDELDTQFIWLMAAFKGLDIPNLHGFTEFSKLERGYQTFLQLPGVQALVLEGKIPFRRLLDEGVKQNVRDLAAVLDSPGASEVSKQFIKILLGSPEVVIRGKISKERLAYIWRINDGLIKISYPFVASIANQELFRDLNIVQAVVDGSFPFEKLEKLLLVSPILQLVSVIQTRFLRSSEPEILSPISIWRSDYIQLATREEIAAMLKDGQAINAALLTITHPLAVELAKKILFTDTGILQAIKNGQNTIGKLKKIVVLNKILGVSVTEWLPAFVRGVVDTYNAIEEFKPFLPEADFLRLNQAIRGLLRAYGLQSDHRINIPESLRDYTTPEALSDLVIYASSHPKESEIMGVYYFLLNPFINTLIESGDITPESWERLSREKFGGIFSNSYLGWYPVIERILLVRRPGSSVERLRDEGHSKVARACFSARFQHISWPAVVNDIICSSRELMIGLILALKSDLSKYIKTPDDLLNTISQFSGWIHYDFIRKRHFFDERLRKEWVQNEGGHDAWLRSADQADERLLESLNMVLDACITDDDKLLATLAAIKESDNYKSPEKQNFTKLIVHNYLWNIDKLLGLIEKLQWHMHGAKMVTLIAQSDVFSIIRNADELIRVVKSLAGYEVTQGLVAVINQSLNFENIQLENNDRLVSVVNELKGCPELVNEIIAAQSRPLLSIVLANAPDHHDSNLTLCIRAVKAFHAAGIDTQVLLKDISENWERILTGADVHVIIEFLKDIKLEFPVYGCELMQRVCVSCPVVLQQATSEQLVELICLFHSSAREDKYYETIKQIMSVAQPHLGAGATIRNVNQLIALLESLRLYEREALASIRSIFNPPGYLNTADGFVIQSVQDLIKIVELLYQIDGTQLVKQFTDRVNWPLIPVKTGDKETVDEFLGKMKPMAKKSDPDLGAVLKTLNVELRSKDAASSLVKPGLLRRVFGRDSKAAERIELAPPSSRSRD